MSTGLYSGASGLALGSGLYKGNPGLWGGAAGLDAGPDAELQATLYLNFLTGAPLDSRVTFTRSTTGTFTGSNGLIQTAAINEPRFDYNPVTLAAEGLLIEEQRTNLIIYSEDYTNPAWVKFSSTVTGNTTVAPNGTTTADTLSGSQGSNSAVNQDDPASAGQVYTYSFYIRKTTATTDGLYSTVSIEFLNGTTPLVEYGAVINSDSGTLIAPSGWGSAPFATSIVENAGDYWRVSVTSSAAPATTNKVTVWLSVAGGFLNGTRGATGTSSKILWGAQLEVGGFSTSYIPTVASQVIRGADVATMTGTNFSSWYNASEGTFVAAYEASPNTFTTYLAASNGVVAQNSMHMDNDGSGNMRVAYYSGSSAVALLTLGAVGTIGAVNRMATAYKLNDFAASRNGGAVATDTTGAVPASVNRLNIGADPSGAEVNVSNTHIRTVAYYNTRLPNATLQALTV